ncbi:MAG: hypothetical protein QOH41_836 [Blastocatellia bacterium]|nr:hypothetical protein [Blastocatellia bacterium]
MSFSCKTVFYPRNSTFISIARLERRTDTKKEAGKVPPLNEPQRFGELRLLQPRPRGSHRQIARARHHLDGFSDLRIFFRQNLHRSDSTVRGCC